MPPSCPDVSSASPGSPVSRCSYEPWNTRQKKSDSASGSKHSVCVHLQKLNSTEIDAVNPCMHKLPVTLHAHTHRNIHVCLAMFGILY